MKLISTVAIAAAFIGVALLIAAPTATAAPPQCTNCQMDTIITYPIDAPSCYAGTTLTIQGVRDGDCYSNCTGQRDCEYSLTIEAAANAGYTCDMAIGHAVDHACGIYPGTWCTSCRYLSLTHTADPETITCGSVDGSECYAVSVCNAGGPGCTFAPNIVTKVQFKCQACA